MFSPNSAEKINKAIARSSYPDISVETLLAAFKAEGIESLEDLAQQMVQALQDSKGQPVRLSYSDLFTQPTPKDIRDSIVHYVPAVPFIMDGVTHDPEDITRYNGEELGFIPQEGGTQLLVIRGKDTWGPLVQTLLVSRAVAHGLNELDQYQFGGYRWVTPRNSPIIIIPPPPPGTVPPPAPPWIALWTDINLSGNAIDLNPGESYRDLRNVGWWLFAGDWNDQFSSITRTSSLCMVFEHINFQGSFLFVGPSETHWLDLHSFGWGDRTSSVINSG